MSRRASVDETGVQRWDRSRWISVFSSHNPTIREVTECLGLGLSASSSTTNRGIPKFDNPEYRKISSEVTKLSKELPKEREALLDFAADPQSLDQKLEELLSVYGPAIWGKDTDRTCLLKPDDSKKTYTKDLFFEVPEDKETLKIHLHRWIIIKACYYIRNMKLKRSSIEYETIADIDMEGAESPKPQLLVKLPVASSLSSILNESQSPDGTPQHSASPPPATDFSVKAEPDRLINARKRKSSAHVSLSDGEENLRGVTKRPYHSATVPLPRKSPRKSLKSLAMASPPNENVPPIPSQPLQFHAPVAAGSAPESARPLLSPLTSNDLNGAARPTNTSPSTFTAVNSASSPHGTPHPRNYSSPYGPPGSQNTTSSQQTPAPTVGTAHGTPNGFHAINSPVLSNVPSVRNSPVIQNMTYANIAPQPSAAPPQHQSAPHPQPPPHQHSTPHPQAVSQHTPHPHGSPHPQSTPHPQSLPHPQSTSYPPNGHQPQNFPHPQSAPHPHSAPHLQNGAHSQAVHNPQTAPHPQPHMAHHPQNSHHVPHQQTAHHVHIAPISPIITHSLQPPSALPIQKILKSQPTEMLQPGNDTDLLQCELLGSLMQYLFPKPDAKPSEVALLRNLEYLWNLKATSFRQQLGHLYDVQSKVLLAWVEERHKISQLRRSMENEPGVPAPEMVDRLLAMNDLRVLRLKWKTMNSLDGNQTLSPEDLLCRTFALMTNTEGTEYLFKDGLDKLNDNMFEFLRSEDMKIMMTKR